METITTLELWPTKAKNIIIEKGLVVRKLQHQFEKIIFPWNDNYDQQRMLFSTQIQERPLFIIQAVCEDEIISVLNLLRDYVLTIRIVGGRHSTALQNPNIFLDMSRFNKITLKKYLKVGAGVTQGQVNDFLFTHHKGLHFPGCKPNHPNNLAFPGGSAVTVGSVGISTVGGIGTLRRTLGLTIDSIKSFRIVIAGLKSASVITASKSKNSDLYWALLGGGGANFGVITEIKYYPLKINKVILYEILWDWSEAANVLDLWQATAPSRSNAFNEDLSLYNGAGGDINKLGINITGIYVIPDEQSSSEAKRIVIEEVKSLGGKLFIEESMSYDKLYSKFAASRVYHNFSTGRTVLTENIVPSKIVIDRLELSRNINSYSYIGLQLMGGKISERTSNETAYYPREAKFFVDIFNFWNSPVDQEFSQNWNSQTFQELYPILGPYCYLGFPIPNLPHHLNAYYGENTKRLLEVKKKVDPLGLLRFPGSL